MAATSAMVFGYGLVLLAAAALLETLARHAALRSDRYRTAGFTYHPAKDVWTCPEDQHLWPHLLDEEKRLMRYRAKPSTCNACHTKPACTDSTDGRELVRPIDPWPHSEAGRFHRGLSVVLTALSACFVASGVLMHHGAVELGVGLPLLAAVLVLGGRWAYDLVRTPSGFPGDPAGRWARDTAPTEHDRQGSGSVEPVLVDLLPPSRRMVHSRWASDREPTDRYRDPAPRKDTPT